MPHCCPVYRRGHLGVRGDAVSIDIARWRYMYAALPMLSGFALMAAHVRPLTHLIAPKYMA
jgi:hypothetical protein